MKPNPQVTGTCLRHLEFIFDVDDTERMVVSFLEDNCGMWQCRVIVGDSYNEKRDNYNVPYGCEPGFMLAEACANDWLKFHRLTPEGIEDI